MGSKVRRPHKTILLHAALIFGAIIFSLPFFWLITTALKPLERANVFPPDIIPMAQDTWKVSGAMRKVYLWNMSGRETRVAKIRENDTGKWTVVLVGSDIPPLPRGWPDANEWGSGDSYLVSPDQLRPVLHPKLMWGNFVRAITFLPKEYSGGLVPLWNTAYLTILCIIGTVLSSSMVAFAFSRLRWPCRDMLFMLMLATMMVPGAVTMLPGFLIFRWLGWVDTLKPLWVGAFFGNGFNIFMLRQFFLTIPDELEDAAKIDGCSFFGIYWMIMLPLVKPALAAITVFTFMGTWNSFMGPLIFISSPEKMTISYALQLFQGMHGGEPSLMMAAATMVMLPVLVVFFFAQRYMIQGVTLTGLKG